MIPESKFNRLTQTDILKLHVHYDTSIQEINVSENDDWIYVQGTLNSGIYPDLRSSNDTAILSVLLFRIFFRFPAETCEVLHVRARWTPPPVLVGLSTIYC